MHIQTIQIKTGSDKKFQSVIAQFAHGTRGVQNYEININIQHGKKDQIRLNIDNCTQQNEMENNPKWLNLTPNID